MRMIRGKTVDDTVLTSSNIVEDDYAEYSAGTTYATGDRVIDTTAHRIYESAVDGNLGNALSDETKWINVGPTNKWAMFDAKSGTATSDPALIDVTMNPPGRVDSLALLNLVNAVSARVVVSTDADGTLFDETVSLVSTDGITDWYSWTFEEVQYRTNLYVPDLPLYSNPTIRVVITGSGTADVQCGTLSAGQEKDLGDTLFDGATVGIDDYSRKEADGFGGFNLNERPYSKTASFQSRLNKGAVDGVASVLAAYRATPAVFLGSEEYGSTLIFGFVQTWSIAIDTPLTSLLTIQIQGLT